jgi:hypothetical protein
MIHSNILMLAELTHASSAGLLVKIAIIAPHATHVIQMQQN